MRDVEVALPKGGNVVRIKDARLRRGESVLVNGPSGAGKSTLFRAISGIWPFGKGSIKVPTGAKVMLLPQRPYVPIGTLRAALTYPAPADAFPDAAGARGARRGAAVPICRSPRRGGALGANLVARRAAARRARPRAPRETGLALPRRGDVSARRAAGTGDVPSSPGKAAGRDHRLDRPSSNPAGLPQAPYRAQAGSGRRVGAGGRAGGRVSPPNRAN